MRQKLLHSESDPRPSEWLKCRFRIVYKLVQCNFLKTVY